MSVLGDKALRQLIRDRLMSDTRLAGQCITVSVNRGHVALLGTVDGDEIRRTAVQLVKGIAGVRGEVEDKLDIQ